MSLFIGGLLYHVQQAALEKLLSRFGTLKSFVRRGTFALIDFADEKEAEAAVQGLQGAYIDGCKMDIKWRGAANLGRARPSRSSPRRSSHSTRSDSPRHSSHSNHSASSSSRSSRSSRSRSPRGSSRSGSLRGSSRSGSPRGSSPSDSSGGSSRSDSPRGSSGWSHAASSSRGSSRSSRSRSPRGSGSGPRRSSGSGRSGSPRRSSRSRSPRGSGHSNRSRRSQSPRRSSRSRSPRHSDHSDSGPRRSSRAGVDARPRDVTWLAVHAFEIASFLDPYDVVQLSGVNRHLHTVLGPLASQLKFVFDHHTYGFRTCKSPRNVRVPRVWKNRSANWLDLCHVLHALPVHHYDRQWHAIGAYWFQPRPGDGFLVVQRPRAPVLRSPNSDLVLPFCASTFPYYVFFGGSFCYDVMLVLGLFFFGDFAGGDGSASAHGIFLLRSGLWVAASSDMCEYPYYDRRGWSTASTLEELTHKLPDFFRTLWQCTLFDLPPLAEGVLKSRPETVSLSDPHVLPDPEVLAPSILPCYRGIRVSGDRWDHYTDPPVVMNGNMIMSSLDHAFPDLSSWYYASVCEVVDADETTELPVSLEKMLAVREVSIRTEEWKFYYRGHPVRITRVSDVERAESGNDEQSQVIL